MVMQDPQGAASQLEAMLQAFPDAVFTLDEDGMILDYKGGRAVSTLFAAPEAFVGRPATEVLPPPFAANLRAALEELKTAGAPVSFEYVSRQGGARRWFEARLVSSPGNQVVMVVRDATRRRDAEEQAKSNLRRISSLRAIDQTIASSRDLRLTLSVVLGQVAAELAPDAADILLINAKNALEFATGIGFHTDAWEGRSLASGRSLAERVVESGAMVRIPYARDDDTKPYGLARLQAEGFRCYFGVPLVVKGRVRGVLEIFHRHPLDPDAEWIGFMEALAGQAAIAIENAALLQELQQTHFELSLAYDTTLEGWCRALDLRDRDTQDHTRRVTEATVKLGRRLELGEEELVHVRRGAMLHDIGKMAIPDSILLKKGALTPAEMEEVRRHPRYAYELLSPIPYLAPALDIPRYHHERWDGTGYPYGLQGQDIPIAARLFAVVDVFEALTAQRPYRAGWNTREARAYIEKEAGRQFDPEIAREFTRMLDDAEAGGMTLLTAPTPDLPSD